MAKRSIVWLVLGVVGSVVACGSSSTPDEGAGGEAGSAGSAGSGGSAGSAGSGGAVDDGGPACSLTNGAITATGAFAATVAASTANLDVATPGAIPCQLEFYATGGTDLGDGNGVTGSSNLRCMAQGVDLYHGFSMDILFRPQAGKTYPIGLASAVAKGDGTYAYNGQASLSYEEGPVCGTLQDLSKAWAGKAGVGTLTIDAVSGANVTFTLTAAELEPMSGGLNYKGTGSFTLAGTGTATLVEK